MKLVAEVNVLLSAVRARPALHHPELERILTAEVTFAEVQQYAGRAKETSLDTLLFAVAALPIELVDGEVYTGSMAQAQKLIGQRDPDDADMSALAAS